MEENSKSFSIKQWAEEDRPREKLLLKGKQVLSDAELIAILIRSGSNELTAVDLSRKILNEVNNNLNNLAKLSVNDLIKYNGIGEAKALSIIAALELGGRRQITKVAEKNQIRSSKDIYEYFNPMLRDKDHEEFWVLFLNRSNKIIISEQLSSGGVSGTIVDVKILIKKISEYLSASIVLCHNHPSGNNQPSQTDLELTKKLKEACRLVDVAVLDHIIICDGSYYSFADNGMI